MTDQHEQNNTGAGHTASSEAGEGAGRPAGTVDEDANPPISDPDEETVYDGAGTIPAQDTGGATPGAAIPPYEGRQTGAQNIGETDDPGTGGATQPEEDPEYRSQKPTDTPGGATASPADEHPASEGSETRGDDDGVQAPAQVTGTRHGEDTP
jgi:hypothetical protein